MSILFVYDLFNWDNVFRLDSFIVLRKFEGHHFVKRWVVLLLGHTKTLNMLNLCLICILLHDCDGEAAKLNSFSAERGRQLGAG